MTQSDLDELCGKTDVTPEMLLKLMNDQWYFEQLWNGKAEKGDECTICSTGDAVPNILGR